MSVTYTAYLIDAFGGIHGKGDGFSNETEAMAWAKQELPRVKRRVHFGEALGIRIEIIEKAREMANV